uniref:Uncharacterized protein n=1 Tax=Oryza meridionalis TaxID=40149 RepID=A0A0E0BZ69_9ORYZ
MASGAGFASPTAEPSAVRGTGERVQIEASPPRSLRRMRRAPSAISSPHTRIDDVRSGPVVKQPLVQIQVEILGQEAPGAWPGGSRMRVNSEWKVVNEMP